MAIQLKPKLEWDNQGIGRFYHEVKGERKTLMEVMVTETKRLVIKHTEVSADLAGQGYGKNLVEEAVKYVENKGLTILAVCPYAKNVLLNNKDIFGHILM